MALEKRYNFSLDDLDVVANGYTCFQSYLKNEEGKHVGPYKKSFQEGIYNVQPENI